MENECKHAKVRFVVDAPLDEYFRCSLNEDGISYGYCCTKCTPAPRGIVIGREMNYKPKQGQYFNEFKNIRDVFSKKIINLNLILENGKVFGTSSSLLTKSTLADLKEKEYKVIVEKRNKKRNTVSVEVLKRHCLYMCIPSKCSICIRELNIPKEYYDYASENAKELIPYVIEEILENESEVEEMIGENNTQSVENNIRVEKVKEEHFDESIALKEELDEEFCASKRLFIAEQNNTEDGELEETNDEPVCKKIKEE